MVNEVAVYVLAWMAEGAIVCFLLGRPKNDIGNPFTAFVYVCLWPAWLLIDFFKRDRR